MNQKITFPELVNAISESTGYSKHLSEEFLKELFSLIANTLASGENVKIKTQHRRNADTQERNLPQRTG